MLFSRSVKSFQPRGNWHCWKLLIIGTLGGYQTQQFYLCMIMVVIQYIHACFSFHIEAFWFCASRCAALHHRRDISHSPLHLIWEGGMVLFKKQRRAALYVNYYTKWVLHKRLITALCLNLHVFISNYNVRSQNINISSPPVHPELGKYNVAYK